MNKRFRVVMFALTLMLTLGIMGCAGEDANKDENTNSNNENDNVNSEIDNNATEPEEVTITISSYGLFSDEDYFQEYYVEPLAEIHPHITLEQFQLETDLDDIEDHFLAGTTPDIFAGWNGDLTTILDNELGVDLMPYVESTGSDLSRFVDTTIESAMLDGELYGLPYGQQFNALYYNKNIFDLFGVEYPEDGMTWDDTIKLARKVTGERDGTNYKGLSPSGLYRLLNPLGLGSPIEYGTLKNLVKERREDFATVLETVQKIYNIPGNMPDEIESIRDDSGVWEFAGGSVAMVAALNVTEHYAEADFDWGVAQYPSYPQAPDTYEAVDAHFNFLLSTSEHPEEAFKVIDFFSSYDSQKRLATETNTFPVLDDVDLMMDFVDAAESTGDIDFSGVLKSSPAKQSVLHESRHDTRGLFYDHTVEMLEEGKDINTILSEYEQEIDVLIEDYKGKN